MDRVRFGRALGYGARHAMKTVVAAVDAATTEAPASNEANARANNGQATAPQAGSGAVIGTVLPAIVQPPATPIANVARTTARTVAKTRGTQRGLRHGTRRFGEAVWRPFVRLSGVVGLQVSGVFFGIFAVVALGAVVRLRADWRPHSAGNAELLVATAMLVVFGYFCISNFARARRRERQR